MEVSSGLALLNQLLEEPPKELLPCPPLVEDSESESQSSVPPDIPASVPPHIPEPPAIPASDLPVQDGDDVASQEVDSKDLSSDTTLVSRLLDSTPTTLLPQPTPPPSPSSQSSSSAAAPSAPNQSKDLFSTPERTLTKITRARRSRKGAKVPSEASFPMRKSTRPSPVPTTRKIVAESPNRFSTLNDEGDTQQ